MTFSNDLGRHIERKMMQNLSQMFVQMVNTFPLTFQNDRRLCCGRLWVDGSVVFCREAGGWDRQGRSIIWGWTWLLYTLDSASFSLKNVCIGICIWQVREWLDPLTRINKRTFRIYLNLYWGFVYYFFNSICSVETQDNKHNGSLSCSSWR